MDRKAKSLLFQQCFYWNKTMYQVTCSNAVFRHSSQSFCHSLMALPMICCSKSAQ